jgi:adenylate cyclase class IV
MARNIEIKARVADLVLVEARARAIATRGAEDLVQDDTFFHCARGRLKLRELADGRGELIHYSRADEAGPKLSDYSITPTRTPTELRETLARACGILGRVLKKRRLYVVDRTRIHLDQVEGLGTFVEIEVVLGDAQSEPQGRAIAIELMARLGIGKDQGAECTRCSSSAGWPRRGNGAWPSSPWTRRPRAGRSSSARDSSSSAIHIRCAPARMIPAR